MKVSKYCFGQKATSGMTLKVGPDFWSVTLVSVGNFWHITHLLAIFLTSFEVSKCILVAH
jgi:hypothetical protein